MDDPRNTKRLALRRAVFHLVLGVVILDSVALAVYFLAGIERMSGRTRTGFTVVWLVLTMMVVLPLLQRVRKARYSRPTRGSR